MHVSRGVVFHSTRAARVGRLPARGGGGRLHRSLLRRRLGPGAADRAPVRRDAVRGARGLVGQVPLEAPAFSSASISSPTATTIAPNGCASRARCRRRARCRGVEEQQHQGARRPGREPRRRAVAAATSTRSSGPRRGGTWRPSTRASRRTGRSPGSSSGPGGSSTSTSTRTEPGALSGPRASRTGSRRFPRRGSSCRLISGTELVGFVVLATPRDGDRRQLGGARPAQDREPAGGELPRPDPGDRSAARGAQVRRVQPDVGVRRPRPEEPRRAALADAEERRAPSRQSRVPARHAGDGRARRRSA